MKIVVLDAETLGADLDLTPLMAVGEVTVYPVTSPEEIEARIADAEVIIANKARLTADVLSHAVKLRMIAEAATGYDNIDLSYCRRAGIAVANIAGYSTASVAQVTVATVLELVTHIRAYTDFVNSGAYSCGNCFNRVEPVYHELAGMTWGIVGYGNIGQAVARVAAAFGCHVVAYTRTQRDGVKCLSLDDICRTADILTLHIPLTPETRGLIGKRELSLMRHGAVLVNEARGAVVDEAAIAAAVLEGKILFGCDTYAVEPFGTEHPYGALLGHPAVCLTPHMAWGSSEARRRCLAEIITNIRAFSKGVRRNRVD